ncbi:MAG: phosphoesterase, MJ0936 family [halophilic archaeon J07HX64]|jgi:phosphoesterase, MJ0936 family|nr:MAG: phosphoesterase, MJ0936 family [halophilic archaeon J07HX64]
MKIGLISDVHGNLPALEAVLDHMPPVERVVCAGDIVGYNPWPAECLEQVRDVASVTVQGNHDRTVETPERYSANQMAMEGLRYAQSELDEKQREWLATRPKQTTIADGEYRLVHSHPDPDELGSYVRPRNFPEMRPHLDEHEGIVLGHTHIQHKAVVDDRLVVNPGSVGQPRDGDPDAAYAVLDPDAGTVDLHRVEYDIESVITRVEDAGLPRRTGTRLLDGS